MPDENELQFQEHEDSTKPELDAVPDPDFPTPDESTPSDYSDDLGVLEHLDDFADLDDLDDPGEATDPGLQPSPVFEYVEENMDTNEFAAAPDVESALDEEVFASDGDLDDVGEDTFT